MKPRHAPGRLKPAPENFLDAGQVAAVQAGRRDFLRGAFLAAAAAVAPAKAGAESNATAANAGTQSPSGEPAILELPEHSRALGQPVAARGYGLPSQYEGNLQR